MNVIKPLIIYAMVSPTMLRDLGTLYGNMSKLEYDRYRIAIKNLEELLLFDDDTGSITNTESVIAKLTLILRDLEHSKINVFVRETSKCLETPGNKVIVNFNYATSIPMFVERYHRYQSSIGGQCHLPMVLSGETKKNLRTDIIDMFNEPSNNRRLIIATIKTGSMGINLHDTFGAFPRFTLMSPSYSIQDLHQAAGRTAREGSKSLATVRLVYGKKCDQEMEQISAKEQRIMDALCRKKDLMKEILDQAVRDGIKFPGEYQIISTIPDISLMNNIDSFASDIGINKITQSQCNGIFTGRERYQPTSGEGDPKIVKLSK
jgi:hypothetical protein